MYALGRAGPGHLRDRPRLLQGLARAARLEREGSTAERARGAAGDAAARRQVGPVPGRT